MELTKVKTRIPIDINRVYGSIRVSSKANIGYNCVCVVCGKETKKRSDSIVKNKGDSSNSICFCYHDGNRTIGKIFGSIKVLEVSHEKQRGSSKIYKGQCLVCAKISHKSLGALKKGRGNLEQNYCNCGQIGLTKKPQRFKTHEVEELVGRDTHWRKSRIIRRYFGNDLWELWLADKE